MEDDDDRFEPVHQRSAAAAASLRCDRCGSSSCVVTDTGEVVCFECGTQSQDVRNIEGEEFEGGGFARTRGGVAIVRRTKRGPKEALPTTRDAFSTQALLEALQRVLDAQILQLVRACGCPPGLRDAAARIWFGYLERWAAAPGAPPPAVVVDAHLATGTQLEYWAALHAAGATGPPRVPPISIGLLLCICCAACRLLNTPVLPHDLCAWVRNGTLPFLNAYAALPLPLQAKVAVARALLSPTGPPSPLWLGRMTDVLCTSVGVVLPPVNAPACVARLVNLTRIPAAVVPVAAAICLLDARDRAQQQHTPPGPRSRDPLDALRREVRGETPASYVAGAVATATRLTPGWQGWVREHLAPCSGSGGLAAQRIRAACTVGPWSVGLGCRGCTDDSGSDLPTSSGATPPPAPVPHPDVPLPWTTAQTLAMPRELAGAYVRFVGSSVLHGGDVAPGRGETGYKRGRYGPGASAIVTVANAHEAEALEQLAAMRTSAGAAAAAAAALQAQDAATGSLMALLMGDGDEEAAEAEAEAAAASQGPRDVRVALGARQRLLPTRLTSAVWRQSQLYDVADVSAEIRAWGEEVGREAVPAGACKVAAQSSAHARVADVEPAVAAVRPMHAEEISLAASITVHPPVAALRESGAVGPVALPADDACYAALLSMLSAATDTPVLSIAAQADALLMLLQYYTPLAESSRV